MRLGYFSPFLPHATGVADYSAKLLPHLGRLANVTLFTSRPVPAISPRRFSIRPLDSFLGPLHEGFDMCMYQMGNNVSFHADIYAVLLHYPGVTTLHDLNLHSFYGELLMGRGRKSSYTREMAYAHGLSGARHARRGHQGLTDYKVQGYPLVERVGNISLGVVVHSQYAKRFVAERCPNTPVEHINQPVATTGSPIPSREAKGRLGFDSDDLLLASFGYVSPNKRVDVALRAFASIRESFPNLRYVLVGKVVEGYDLRSMVNELGLGDVVRVVGYVDDDTFRAYLAATDVGINLRHPTSGETSATMLRLMAAGKPTLVSRVDAFVELPDDICMKIDLGPEEQSQVEEALQHLLGNRDLRRELGKKAVDYIRRECRPETVVANYVEFIRQILDKVQTDVL